MNFIKSGFHNMLVCYACMAASGLFAGNILYRCEYPFVALSSLYLIILAVTEFYRFRVRISECGAVKRYLCTIAAFAVFWMLARMAKYAILLTDSTASRYTWYLYYTPMLVMPVLSCCAALYLDTRHPKLIKHLMYAFMSVTVLLILFVLTNDIHQLIFRFKPGFEKWDSDYGYGFGFVIINVWEYGMYLAAEVIMVIKCRLSSVRRYAWLPVIPFIVGITLILMSITGNMVQYRGEYLYQFPELYCSMIMIFWECCFSMGLIPTNESYARLLRQSALQLAIVDGDKNIVYSSDTFGALPSKKDFGTPSQLLDVNTVLRSFRIRSGYGLIKTDITQLNSLNRELSEVREQLLEEAELIRLENELSEKRAGIEHHTKLYNEIAARTHAQSMRISELSEQVYSHENAKQICFLAAYIKRTANMMLLSDETGSIFGEELGLAVAESLRYLNKAGIAAEYMCSIDREIPIETAFRAYAVFEKVLEDNYAALNGVYAVLSGIKDGIMLKLSLEGDEICLPEEADGMTAYKEDEITYIQAVFAVSEGGERL